MRAIRSKDPGDKSDKKEKRQARRAKRKAERALNPFNQPPKTRRGNSKGSAGLFDDGLSGGGCKDGNNRDFCPEVQTTTSGKAPNFNPNKRRVSKSRLVGSAKKRKKEAKKAARKAIRAAKGKNTPYGNPRLL